MFGERIYLTCYTGYGVDPMAPGDPANLKRHLLCINRDDGSIVWNAPAPATTPETKYGGYIALHGYASSTPAADADRVSAWRGSSIGSRDSHCAARFPSPGR